MTSKRLLQTCGAQIAKAAFCFSLVLGWLTWGTADERTLSSLAKGMPPREALDLLAKEAKQGNLADDVAKVVLSAHSDVKRGKLEGEALTRKIEGIVQKLELFESSNPPSSNGDPVALAAEIKKSPIYRDPGLKEESSWLAGAASRLGNLRFDPQCNSPDVNTNGPALMPPWTLNIVWGLLAIGVGVFLWFAFRHFAWSKRLERKARAMLDEDEPERTVDEWLALAASLESDGKFREAIRCLYLACLLRIDEARIARFERGQTNWEHLARIEASPTRPRSLDFRPPTKAFDEAWYGMRHGGNEQVAKFRQWYREISEYARVKAA